jgi:hypothetical protein
MSLINIYGTKLHTYSYFLWENSLRVPRIRHTRRFLGMHVALDYEAGLPTRQALLRYLQCAQGVVIFVGWAGLNHIG